MSIVVYTILELLAYAFQGLVFSFWLTKQLPVRNRKYEKLYHIAVCSVTLLTLMAFDKLVDIEFFKDSIYLYRSLIIFIVLLLSTLMLKGSLLKKTLLSCAAALVHWLTAFLTYWSYVEIIGIWELSNNKVGLTHFLAIVVSECFCYLVFRALLNLLRRTDEKIECYKWDMLTVCVLGFSCCAAVVDAIINRVGGLHNDNETPLLEFTVVMILMLCVLIVVLCDSVSKKRRAEKELENLRLKEHYQQQYLENSRLQYDSLKKLRHDTKNSFLTINELLSQGETEKAAEFTQEYTNRISSTQSYVNTQSSVVNAIINYKLSSASAMGIKVSCISANSFKGIDDVDMCSLLSNMLDNAVTACLEIPQNETREVVVEISCENESCYTFLVKNTVRSSVLEANPELETTKQSTDKHGCGKKILSDIAEKYKGRLEFYEEYSMFCCKIDLFTAAPEQSGVPAKGEQGSDELQDTRSAAMTALKKKRIIRLAVFACLIAAAGIVLLANRLHYNSMFERYAQPILSKSNLQTYNDVWFQHGSEGYSFLDDHNLVECSARYFVKKRSGIETQIDLSYSMEISGKVVYSVNISEYELNQDDPNNNKYLFSIGFRTDPELSVSNGNGHYYSNDRDMSKGEIKELASRYEADLKYVFDTMYEYYGRDSFGKHP